MTPTMQGARFRALCPDCRGSFELAAGALRLRHHDVAAPLRGEELRHVFRSGHTLPRPVLVPFAILARVVRGREDEDPLQPLHSPRTLRDGAVEVGMLR